MDGTSTAGDLWGTVRSNNRRRLTRLDSQEEETQVHRHGHFPPVTTVFSSYLSGVLLTGK